MQNRCELCLIHPHLTHLNHWNAKKHLHIYENKFSNSLHKLTQNIARSSTKLTNNTNNTTQLTRQQRKTTYVSSCHGAQDPSSAAIVYIHVILCCKQNINHIWEVVGFRFDIYIQTFFHRFVCTFWVICSGKVWITIDNDPFINRYQHLPDKLVWLYYLLPTSLLLLPPPSPNAPPSHFLFTNSSCLVRFAKLKPKTLFS